MIMFDVMTIITFYYITPRSVAVRNRRTYSVPPQSFVLKILHPEAASYFLEPSLKSAPNWKHVTAKVYARAPIGCKT